MKLNIYRSIAAPGKRLFPFLMCLAFVISGFLISGALTVVNAQPRTVNRRANQGERSQLFKRSKDAKEPAF
jgi:hypothetical protein